MKQRSVTLLMTALIVMGVSVPMLGQARAAAPRSGVGRSSVIGAEAANALEVPPGLAAERRIVELERQLTDLRAQLASCQGQLVTMLFKPLNDAHLQKLQAWCDRVAAAAPTLMCNDRWEVVRRPDPTPARPKPSS